MTRRTTRFGRVGALMVCAACLVGLALWMSFPRSPRAGAATGGPGQPKIAYVVYGVSDSEHGDSTIKYLKPMTRDDGGATLYHTEDQFDIAAVQPSHDGALVLICARMTDNRGKGGYSLHVISPDGKIVRELAPGWFPQIEWSPDDHQVLFISAEVYGAGHPEEAGGMKNINVLYSQQIEGVKPKKLAPNVYSAVWLPGGHDILFTSNRRPGLFLVRSEGGVPRQIHDIPPRSALFLAPNARRVAWKWGELGRKVVVADLTSDPHTRTATVKPVASFVLPEYPNGMAFSPKSDVLAVLVPTPETAGDVAGVWMHRLVLIDVSGNRVRMLGILDNAPSSGIFHGTLPGDLDATDYDIWPTSGSDLRWTGDGRYLVMGNRDGNFIAVNAEGGSAQPIDKLDWKAATPAKITTLWTCPHPGKYTSCEVEWAEVH